MPEPSIQVAGLAKQYRLGGLAAVHTTLRDAIAAQWQRCRGLASGHAASSGHETFWALRDIDFAVQPGECVGVIGRNGAGKSTLLKVLSRITAPTRGEVRLRGRVGSLLEVGTGFHPELTGRENVYLNGSVLGMRKAEIDRKFDEIVAFAGVERFLDTPVKRYSSGMSVRLAFAVAAHLDLEVLVVDEVLAVGDAAFQRKCLGRMQSVAGEGRTVLFVSHNLALVSRLCQRGLLLDGGRLVADGPAGEVLNEYQRRSQGTLRGNVVDLSGQPSLGGAGEVRVHSLTLENAIDGCLAAPWDEPLRLTLRFTPTRPLSRVGLGIACQTTDFANLFTAFSHPQAEGAYDLQPGVTYTVTAQIAHRVRTGLYNLQVGLTAGSRRCYYNPNAAQIEIACRENDERYAMRANGVIDVDSTWTLREATPVAAAA